MNEDVKYLVDWTTLSADKFGECYSKSKPSNVGLIWQVIIALGGDDPKKFGAQKAMETGFFDRLVDNIVNMEAENGRPGPEIGALLDRAQPNGMRQRIVNERGSFKSPAILRRLVGASRACAKVDQTAASVVPLGTAFLVAPDMVMTAAHVVMGHNDNDGWSDKLISNLLFHFEENPKGEHLGMMSVRPAYEKPLICFARPHGESLGSLESSLAPPADEHLDFALIRLAQRVDHIPPISINDDAKFSKDEDCWVFGYPGGNQQVFDVDSVEVVDERSGRWLHKANTASGMSGGCCVNHEGELAGLHEGSVPHEIDGEMVDRNRGIGIAAIRRAQRKDGTDPLNVSSRTPGLEIRDAELVKHLYNAGKRALPASIGDIWKAQATAALGVDPELTTSTIPVFHPWFARSDVEAWIDSDDNMDRLCLIHGERGSGKTFCQRILQEKLVSQGADLLSLSATQTTSMSWKDAIGQELSSETSPYRTQAASVRYDDLATLVAELFERSDEGRRTRYVSIDFGNAGLDSLDGKPWFALIRDLLLHNWVKIMIIGLDEGARIALFDFIEKSAIGGDVEIKELEIDYISDTDFRNYSRDLRKARGEPPNEAELRAEIKALLDELRSDLAAFEGNSGTEHLQTIIAALAAIRLERALS